jgi:hypothetical protein
VRWLPHEYLMVRCWVDGRSWYYQDRGHTAEEAKKLAWDAWFALSDGQRKLMLAIVVLAPADRPCYAVMGKKGGD